MKKYAYLLLILFLFSCKKDMPPVREDGLVAGTDVALVICEGNFLLGNASLCKIDLTTSTVDDHVFSDVNGQPLGDVCQSLCFASGKGYVVVNNSQKIEVCRPDTWQRENTLSGFTSPRYMVQVNPGKAYVSDLYAGSISIVNLTSLNITGSIACTGWSEEMIVAGSYVFVTRPATAYSKVINIYTDQVVDSISTGLGSNSAVQDANGKIWILSSGDAGSGVPGQLTRINPANLSVEMQITLSGSPHSLRTNPAADKLYYLDNGVYSLPIASTTAPGSAFIAQAGGSAYYGLDIHPITGEIFICDALDYIQYGKVYRYNATGSLLNTYTVGYLPNHVYFP